MILGYYSTLFRLSSLSADLCSVSLKFLCFSIIYGNLLGDIGGIDFAMGSSMESVLSL